MKAVLREISDQLHLCAALMSDPVVIRSQPHVVAAQFVSAARRIEQLQSYLVKPARAAHDRPWFDKSVLEGVSRLVNAALHRHMRPLGRGFKFPKIFERELFLEWTGRENALEREIKETNCMGGMILLYYYLYWHLMLILLNRHYHPALFDGGVRMDDEDEDTYVFDFKTEFLDKLPNKNELLNTRWLGNLSNANLTTALNSGIGAKVMVNHTPANNTITANRAPRRTHSVDFLREVLGIVMDPNDGAKDKISSELHALLAHVILRKIQMSGNVLSSFDLQDEVAKWEDMYVKFEVQSSSEKDDEKSKVVFSSCPAKVLKSPPYHKDVNEFQQRAREAAVYDYGSIPLMIDISKSLMSLASVVTCLLKGGVKEEDLLKAIAKLIIQAYQSNSDTVKKELEKDDCKNASVDDSKFHDTKYIQVALGHYRARCDISEKIALDPTTMITEFTVDHLAGAYWGARPCDLDSVNHQYYACPDLQIDPQTDSNLLSRFQKLSGDSLEFLQKIIKYFTKLHRNSLFIKNILGAMLTLTGEFKRTRVDFKVNIPRGEVYMPSSTGDCALFEGTATTCIFPRDTCTAITAEGGMPDFTESLQSIRKHLKSELGALEQYAGQIRDGHFNRYPGLSWPIKFKLGQNTGTNYAQFQRVRVLPAVTPSLNYSAHRIANTLSSMYSSPVFGARVADAPPAAGGPPPAAGGAPPAPASG